MSDTPYQILRVTETLAEEYPLLEECPNDPVAQLAEGSLPAGPRLAFERGGIATFGDLGKLTVAELQDIQSVGYATLSDIHRLCRSAQHRWDQGGRDQRAPATVVAHEEPAADALMEETSPVEEVLELVARWAASTSGAITWKEVQDSVSSGPLPTEVHEALARLGDLPTGAPVVSPADVINTWLGQLELRERDVVESRIVRRTSTLDELGLRYEVTRERIRQIESRLKSSLEHLVGHDKGWAVVRWWAQALRKQCGTCAPRRVVDDLGLDDVATGILLIAAGLSTKAVPASVAAEGFTLPSADTYAEPPDHVLLDEKGLRRDLLMAGVREEHIMHVEGLLDVRRVDGHLVLWKNNIVDRSVAHLAARGEPMRSADLLPLSGGNSERGLRDRLLQDSRVHRVNRDEFGLRSWGLPEYTTVVEHMLEVIDASNGSVWLEDLAERLQLSFDIKKGTTMAYSAAPVFVVHDGLIWRRHDDEPYPVPTNVSTAPGLYRIGNRAVSWLVPVDHELARGSGRPSPPALAGVLGLAPGRRLVFSGPSAPVTISWGVRSHVGPGCSTLRQVMHHLGASIGDRIRLELDATCERYSVARVSVGEADEARSGLRALTGVSEVERLSVMESIARAIDVTPNMVLNALEARGDGRVAALLRKVLEEQDDHEGRAAEVARQQEAGA